MSPFAFVRTSPSLAMMADSPKRAEKTRRAQRLQAALRENLKRRKAQARGRAERSATDDAAPEGVRRTATSNGKAE